MGMVVSFNFPYVLAMFLIILSLLVCFLVSWFNSSLTGLLIFMIYVGGVLIMFLYSLSILPNEKNVSFYSDYKSGFFYFFCLWFIFSLQVYHFEMVPMLNNDIYFHYLSVFSFSGLFIFMALILFFLMLVVCNTCDKKRVPLRKLS
uniref:NADH dehydrogenase subunit 6 n=1 Tax=Arcuatula senhousia TaxID=1954227 RepID=E2DHW8_ARCSE|nr:NADH dehydrogenase subunit 6 [Arcuatula senhousia]ACY00229.1 NADH dehydrogenase subunit 6 [Arcuatula senhousia]